LKEAKEELLKYEEKITEVSRAKDGFKRHATMLQERVRKTETEKTDYKKMLCRMSTVSPVRRNESLFNQSAEGGVGYDIERFRQELEDDVSAEDAEDLVSQNQSLKSTLKELRLLSAPKSLRALKQDAIDIDKALSELIEGQKLESQAAFEE